jgi:hypothetical protein
MKQEPRLSPDDRSEIARAIEALEEARGMPRGLERTQALKNAGMLRYAADKRGLTFVKNRRSRNRDNER